MGANCSLPDGSELKPPEERIAHEVMVRANVALVFVKPHATTDACVAFVRKQLIATTGLCILGECSIGGPAIEAGNLIDLHYAEISKVALSTDPADLRVSDEKKELFLETFGVSWDAVIAEGSVLNARECALKLGVAADPETGEEERPLPSKDLLNMWLAAADKVKVASGAYVARLKGGAASPDDYDDDDAAAADDDAGNLFVVDGFYPAMREKFTKDDATIRTFVVAFDPQLLSWAKFRGQVIGPTDPTVAPPGSVRGQIFAQWEALGLSEQPNNTDNGVHASAGPLEGLKERMVWLGFALDSDPIGARLAELAVWDPSKRAVLESLLENPTVTFNGLKQAVFDLTEDKDTPDLYQIANNVAFASELEGIV